MRKVPPLREWRDLIRNALLRLIAGRVTVIINADIRGGVFVGHNHGAVLANTTVALHRKPSDALYVAQRIGRIWLSDTELDARTDRTWDDIPASGAAVRLGVGEPQPMPKDGAPIYLYRMWIDPSNYERVELFWTGNILNIHYQAAGVGVARREISPGSGWAL